MSTNMVCPRSKKAMPQTSFILKSVGKTCELLLLLIAAGQLGLAGSGGVR